MALYGVCEGKRLKAFGYNKGMNAKGLWQYFMWTEKERDATKTLIPKYKYQIWIYNEEELDLEDGAEVIITKVFGSCNRDAYVKVDGKNKKIAMNHISCLVERYESKKSLKEKEENRIQEELDNYDFL